MNTTGSRHHCPEGSCTYTTTSLFAMRKHRERCNHKYQSQGNTHLLGRAVDSGPETVDIPDEVGLPSALPGTESPRIEEHGTTYPS